MTAFQTCGKLFLPEEQQSWMGQTRREMGFCMHWEPLGQTENQGQNDEEDKKALNPELVEGSWEERGLPMEQINREVFCFKLFSILLNKFCGFSVLQSLMITLIFL